MHSLKVLKTCAEMAVPEGALGVRGDLARLDPHARTARARCSAALVSMPWNSITRPSIQIGLLKAITASHGFPVEAFHLNLDLAAQAGARLYDAISQTIQVHIGEWLFSAAAFGDTAPDLEARFLADFREALEHELSHIDQPIEQLRTLRSEVIPRYLDQLIATIPWGQFRVVGFTSTFQQSMPSFALAARIKQRWPDVVTVFGGANFDGEMGEELVRSVDCIDYAVLGEGDRAFPELLVALQEGRDPALVPGVACRRDGRVHVTAPRPPLQELDRLPAPDYDEFFARAEALKLLPLGPRRRVWLPFETARGCWWGAKHHCVFCGLNRETISYRSKSPARVLEELAELTRRYRSFHFTATDNILDHAYRKTLLPELRQRQVDLEFFFEVKANMTRQQIKLLREAGVTQTQPGIEALSLHLLQLMRKGVTALQNVNTLRWFLYYGIEAGWNLLFGFPGETAEDYAEQLQIIQHIPHLQPPMSAGLLGLMRFSPLFFDREAFGVRNLT